VQGHMRDFYPLASEYHLTREVLALALTKLSVAMLTYPLAAGRKVRNRPLSASAGQVREGPAI